MIDFVLFKMDITDFKKRSRHTQVLRFGKFFTVYLMIDYVFSFTRLTLMVNSFNYTALKTYRVLRTFENNNNRWDALFFVDSGRQ